MFCFQHHYPHVATIAVHVGPVFGLYIKLLFLLSRNVDINKKLIRKITRYLENFRDIETNFQDI